MQRRRGRPRAPRRGLVADRSEQARGGSAARRRTGARRRVPRAHRGWVRGEAAVRIRVDVAPARGLPRERSRRGGSQASCPRGALRGHGRARLGGRRRDDRGRALRDRRHPRHRLRARRRVRRGHARRDWPRGGGLHHLHAQPSGHRSGRRLRQRLARTRKKPPGRRRRGGRVRRRATQRHRSARRVRNSSSCGAPRRPRRASSRRSSSAARGPRASARFSFRLRFRLDAERWTP